MAELPTPDNIGSLPRSRTGLIPAAQPLSVYQGGTRANVPEAPQDNSYLQLSRALHGSAGTMNQVIGHIADIKREKDTATGQVAGEKAAHDQSVKNVNDIVSKGHLDPGASPTAIFAAHTNFAKLRGVQSQMNAREDYYSNTALRNDPTPGAYERWASKWRDSNAKSILFDEAGNKNFSDLEIARSGFHELVDNGLKGLQSEHIAHRISENEKFQRKTAADLASAGLQRVLGTDLNPVAKENRDLPGAANAVKDAYWGPTGQVRFGAMNPTLASNDMSDAIITHAIAQKDASLLAVGDHLETGNGSVLSGGAYFKEHATAARDHIAGVRYTDAKHELELSLMKVDGTVDEQVAAYAEKLQRSKSEELKKNAATAYEAKLWSYDLDHQTPAMQQEHTETQAALKGVDAKAALDYDMARRKITEQKFDYAHNRTVDVEEAKLQLMVAKDPGSALTNQRLMNALKAELITGAGYRRLLDESNQSGADERDPRIKKILSSRDYTMLEEKVGAGVSKDLSKISGQESISAGIAMNQFRSEARTMLKKNPNWDAADLSGYMVKRLEPTALQFNDVANQEFVAKKAAKDVEDATIKKISDMQARAAKEVEQLRKMPPVQDGQAKHIAAPPAEQPQATFGPKNETRYQAFKKKYASSPLSDVELRQAFREGKTPQ